jgi:hypothetical protein
MSGPYQSRIFNFINRKTIQFRDRFAQSKRSLLEAATLGIQVILYPLYLLAQTGRVALRQLKQTTYKVALFLTNSLASDQEQLSTTIHDFSQFPPSDKPIKDILNLIELPQSENLELPNIIGFTSILETRKLALVGHNNQIFDLFTTQQQQQIKHLISWELANYWRRIRLNYKLQQSPRCLPLIHANNPHLLPPVRLFWQLIEWIQNSQLAIELNLFEEASFMTSITLVKNPETQLEFSDFIENINEKNSQLSVNQQSPIQNFIKQPAIILDQNNVVFLKIRSLIKAAIDYFLKVRDKKTYLKYYHFSWDLSQLNSGKQELIESKPKELLNNRHNNTILSQENHLEKEPKIDDDFQIWVLIKAAIDYFLRKNKTIISQQNYPLETTINSETFSLYPTNFQQLSLENKLSNIIVEPDPWLTYNDLFQGGNFQPNFQGYQNNYSVELPFLPIHDPQEIEAENSWLESEQTLVKLTENPENQAEKPNLITYHNLETDLSDIDPEWIEIEAKSVGYEKHPLELILQWLDRIILLIEEYLLRFWDWLNHK